MGDNSLQLISFANSLSTHLHNLVSSKGKNYESNTRNRRIYHSLRNDWWRGKSNFSKAGDDGYFIWSINQCYGLCSCFCCCGLCCKKKPSTNLLTASTKSVIKIKIRKTMNKVLGIGLIGLGAYGLIKLLRMKNVSDSISTNLVNPRIHKVSLSGISFRTEVAINNPTKDSVKITKPVVTLTTNGKLLSQSNSENKTITIEPLNVSQIDTIELVIGWTTIGTFVAGILKKIPQLVAAFKPGSNSDMFVVSTFKVLKSSTPVQPIF